MKKLDFIRDHWLLLSTITIIWLGTVAAIWNFGFWMRFGINAFAYASPFEVLKAMFVPSGLVLIVLANSWFLVTRIVGKRFCLYATLAGLTICIIVLTGWPDIGMHHRWMRGFGLIVTILTAASVSYLAVDLVAIFKDVDISERVKYAVMCVPLTIVGMSFFASFTLRDSFVNGKRQHQRIVNVAYPNTLGDTSVANLMVIGTLGNKLFVTDSANTRVVIINLEQVGHIVTTR